MQFIYDKFFYVFIFASLLIIVFGDYLIVLFHSSKYIITYIPIAVLAIITAWHQLSTYNIAFINMIGKPKISLYIGSVAAGASLLISPLLVYYYSYTGAVAASIIVLTINFLISYNAVAKEIPLRINR
jgi:O-antigen/teichoic acid export membrane protein